MKVLKETQGIKTLLKCSLIAIAILSISVACKAQEEMAFPFQGGAAIMNRFFKDSINMSSDIIERKAAGTAIFKFTADVNGNISKIVIYYADDYVLTPPLIEALRRSSHKWIIPNHEKFHDFLLPFSIGFTPPATDEPLIRKAFYTFYKQRRPILSADQIPVASATLLPTITINYSIPK